MIELIIDFLKMLQSSLENSVFMGPDGILYECAVILCYAYLQSYVFLIPNFLKRLPKRSTMGIVAMVLIFLPGIVVRTFSEYIVKIAKNMVRLRKDSKRKGGRKVNVRE